MELVNQWARIKKMSDLSSLKVMKQLVISYCPQDAKRTGCESMSLTTKLDNQVLESMRAQMPIAMKPTPAASFSARGGI